MQALRPQTTLFCAVLALTIALSVLLRGRRRPIHWLFAAFSTEVAVWWASQSFIGIFQATIWVRATAVTTIFLPQFTVHLFQSIVPAAEGAGTTSRFMTPLAKSAAFAGIPMLVLVLSPYHEKPFALGLVYTYVVGFLWAALIDMWRRGKKSPSRAVRDRVRFLFWVGALATTFTLGDFLSFLGVRLPPIGAVLSTVFIFVLAESMARPRLADLYEMAGRLLVATVLAFALAGVFWIFVTVVGGFNTMYLNAVLAALVFLMLFDPIRHEVEKRTHQFFFRERFALETSVAELRRRLAHVLEIDEMVQTILVGIESSRRVTSCAIYLRDQEANGYDLLGSVGSAPPRRIETLSARPLLDRLHAVPSVSLEELEREPKDADAPVLTAAAATLGELKRSVVLAVRADSDEVIGLICVADERVRDAFTPEEVSLLETLASQIAVAVTNSRLYSRMKERDRLAALGAMAAGLAHEVKNPLGAIKGAAQLLEGSPSGDPASSEFVGIILEEVDRLNRVVGSFLTYARPHAGNPVPLDVNAAVRRTVQILSSQKAAEKGDDIEIKLELAEGLPRVKIDPEQLRQVLMNLVQNAMQAMDGEGRVTLSTAVRRRPRATWGTGLESERMVGSRPEDEVVEVAVRDTGPGISQTIMKNLFVPFFTTKAQGTGLGLAISQSIIRSAGGSIDAQSHSGAGTTFLVALPVATDVLASMAPAVSAPASAPEPIGPPLKA
ncbi:MAG: GAF domain-containing protein [Myxococcales bacterium]|nr:GAF domain-containing protein [Myxococcales bacterium]